MPRRSFPTLLKDEFSGYSVDKLRQDALAGLTVAAVALPLALAFGVASGATVAAAGLVTAIFVGGDSLQFRPTVQDCHHHVRHHHGGTLMLAGIHTEVMKMLERGGLVGIIGAENIASSADQAIVAAEARGCSLCRMEKPGRGL